MQIYPLKYVENMEFFQLCSDDQAGKSFQAIMAILGGIFSSFSATISYFEHPMWDQFDWGLLAQSGKFPSDRCDTLEKI